MFSWQTVMDRLEDEAAAAKQRLEEEYHAREEALQGKHSTEMREMEAAMERIAEKNRAVSRAQQQQEEELAEAKRAAQELERELKARNGTISWMESQVGFCQESHGGLVHGVFLH